MSKHTPGPWRWWETVSGARVAGRPADGSKNFVCDVLQPELAVNYEDNARLIAAAPDLLEALQAFLRVSHCLPELSGSTAVMVLQAQACARSTIARATGETS